MDQDQYVDRAPFGSLYGASFLIFTLVHFEIRYFYLLKIFSFSTAISLISIAWAVRRVPRSVRLKADPA